MAARRFLLLASLSFTVAALAPSPARAEDAAAPEVPNAKYNFLGEINGNNVFVRSGPSDSYYPTTKLPKGTQVKVVGMKFQYLKIEPPPGSFSYVGKAYVERRGDGSVGRVTTAANVRTGSELNSMKTTVQTKLDPGTDVKILGEQDEYYKVEPPPGAYLYVHQQFVEAKGPAGGPEQGVAANRGDGQVETPRPQPAEPTAKPTPTPGTGEIAEIITGDKPQPPTTESVTEGGANPQTAPSRGGPDTQATATTRPNDTQPTSADAKFEQLEAQFADASKQPVIEQPLDDLLGGYQALVKDESLAESLKRIADARIVALKTRQEAKQEFLAVRKSQDEAAARRKALQAEREELEEQIRQSQVEFFAAVGTLRNSSLQQGPRGTTLYRLTDPDTGRTLVYVRSNDKQMTAMLNQFVGVKGELRNDPLLRMRVVTPTETKQVDRSKVGSTIAATVLPPSVLPKTPTVSTGSGAAIEGQ